ncbi:hypothetical protein OZ401_005093 (plasmid) [Candidatus Chlorohelix allophototropha]|uniref:Uncharacterized protein n=1 Tax=Candidatus Chlorohelix allophototropha TaxID=3003348 RepID=A0ABY9BBG8_9CHLR|nr:hypothetical protein OZ401_005093 [Chloroflexota bacterium L227-S17]
MPERIRFKNPKTFSTLLRIVSSYEPETYKNETDYNELMYMVNNHYKIGHVTPVKNGFVLDRLDFFQVSKVTRTIELTGMFKVNEVTGYEDGMRITFETFEKVRKVEYTVELSVKQFLTLWHQAIQMHFDEFEEDE